MSNHFVGIIEASLRSQTSHFYIFLIAAKVFSGQEVPILTSFPKMFYRLKRLLPLQITIEPQRKFHLSARSGPGAKFFEVTPKSGLYARIARLRR